MTHVTATATSFYLIRLDQADIYRQIFNLQFATATAVPRTGSTRLHSASDAPGLGGYRASAPSGDRNDSNFLDAFGNILIHFDRPVCKPH